MGRTLRSKRLRNILWRDADGKCPSCGDPLPDNWHADHIVPWRILPETNVHDMQALCPKCNLKKGGRMGFRKHQSEVEQAAKKIRAGNGRSVLAHVVPGGGKSWLPLIMLNQLPPGTKLAWFVPRDNLRTQAAIDAKSKFQIILNDCEGAQRRPSADTSGFVTTHQSLTTDPESWSQEFQRHPYLLVVDELHHACITRDGTPNALASALSRLKWTYRLCMTGTLERHGPEFIYGIQYSPTDDGLAPNGELSADYFVRYSREDGLDERAIVPIEFSHCDGPVKYFDGSTSEEVEWEKLSQVATKDESKGIFTALNTEYAKQLWSTCVDHWKTHGNKLLIVCHSQQAAKSYRKLMSGEPSVYLAISEEKSCPDQIKAFRAATGRAVLVTCQVAYEGLDVPDISHICSLTQIRSVPWIYQMLGRAWRATQNKDRAYCFCPDDRRMNDVIRRIKSEEQRLMRDRSSHDGNGNGSVPTDGKPEILPVSGNIGDIRRSALDGVPISAAQQQFSAIVRQNGMSLEDPVLKAAWHRLGVEAAIPDATETYGEQRTRHRNDLATYCREKDRERGWDWGTTQYKVCQRMRWKKVDDMTIDELKAAYSVATSI